MVTGKMPFEGGNVDATLKLIRTKEPTYPGNLSPEIKVRTACALAFEPGEILFFQRRPPDAPLITSIFDHAPSVGVGFGRTQLCESALRGSVAFLRCALNAGPIG